MLPGCLRLRCQLVATVALALEWMWDCSRFQYIFGIEFSICISSIGRQLSSSGADVELADRIGTGRLGSP